MLAVLVTFITVLSHLLATDEITTSSNKFLVCSAGGDREDCVEHRERAENSLVGALVLTMITTALYSLINLSHLVYVIHFPALKEAVKAIC